jgi:hypothetical protein
MLSTDERQIDSARLLVTWQDPETRAYWRIGVLSHSISEGYDFEYVDGVEQLDGFVPFGGLDDTRKVHHSSELFPIFAERVMDPERDGFAAWLTRLHLDPAATPMEILAKSHGSRGTDTVQLFQVPTIDDKGRTRAQFFVHGVRYFKDASARIDLLQVGQPLSIVDRPENSWDSRALLVADDGAELGYVPGPLLEYAHAIRDVGDIRVRVAAVNPESMGTHFRLLVEVEGTLEPDADLLASMMAGVA